MPDFDFTNYVKPLGSAPEPPTTSRQLPDSLVQGILRNESGGRHYDSQGNVLLGPPTRSGSRAVGRWQVMPDRPNGRTRTIGSQSYDLYNEQQNEAAGRAYLQEGLDKAKGDPKGAALYYFAGPGGLQHYQRTGRLPAGSDKYTSITDYVGNATRPTGRSTRPAAFDFSEYVKPLGTGEKEAPSLPTVRANDVQPTSIREQDVPTLSTVGQTPDVVQHPDNYQWESMDESVRKLPHRRMRPVQPTQGQVVRQATRQAQNLNQQLEAAVSGQPAVPPQPASPAGGAEQPALPPNRVRNQTPVNRFGRITAQATADTYVDPMLARAQQDTQTGQRQRASQQRLAESFIAPEDQRAAIHYQAEKEAERARQSRAEYQRLQAQMTPADREVGERIYQQLQSDPHLLRALDAGLDEVGASTIEELAGGADLGFKLSPVTGPIAAALHLDPRVVTDWLRRRALAIHTGTQQASENFSPAEKVITGGTNLVGGLIKLALLTKGTGAAFGISSGLAAPLSFGALDAARAAGENRPAKDVAIEGAKGIGVGTLFGASHILPVVSEVGEIPAGLERLGARALNTAGRAGMVGGGTYQLERATGVPEGQAAQSAAMTGLFAAGLPAEVGDLAGRIGGRLTRGTAPVESMPAHTEPSGVDARTQAIENFTQTLDQVGARLGTTQAEWDAQHNEAVKAAYDQARQAGLTHQELSDITYNHLKGGQQNEVAPQTQTTASAVAQPPEPQTTNVTSEVTEPEHHSQRQPRQQRTTSKRRRGQFSGPPVEATDESPETQSLPVSDVPSSPQVEAAGGQAEIVNEPMEATSEQLRPTRQPSNPTIKGAESKVSIPGTDRTIPVHYSVRELSDVHSSHDPQTFARNPNYEHTNDRQYDREQTYQTEVINNSKAGQFKPQRLINNSDTAETGPPVIDSNGNVLGGNSRTMMLSRAYRAGHGEAYKQELIRQAGIYGLNARQIAGMRSPILVREMTDETLSKQGAITDLNVSGTRALTPQERGAAEAGRMPTTSLEYISGKIEGAGQDATLSQVLDRDGVQIVNRLIDDGVFQPQERNALIKDGRLLPEAKTRIERMLMGRVFTDVDQLERTPDQIKRNVERIVAPLTSLTGEWDILPEVRGAIDLLSEAKAAGQMNNLPEFIRQTSMFRTRDYTPQEVALAEALKLGPAKTAKAFRTYTNEAVNATEGGGLFGSVSPAEAFKTAFGVERGEARSSGVGEQPRAQAPEQPKAQGNLTRNFRAGTNDAAMTFASETQRDLYDLAAKERYATRGGQTRASQRAVGDVKGLRDALKQRLGVSDSELTDLSQRVHDDVRGQMKGVKHLEERSLVDNVNRPKSSLQNKADAAKARIAETKRRMAEGTMEFRSGGTPLLPEHISYHLNDYIIIGAAHIESGLRDFAEWSKQMVSDLGEEVKPYLKDIYTKSQEEVNANSRTVQATAPVSSTETQGQRELVPTNATGQAVHVGMEGESGGGDLRATARNTSTVGAGATEGVKPTGTANAVTQAERAERGLDPVQKQAYTAIGEAYHEGRQAVESGEVDPRILAQQIANTPRVLSTKEVGVLGFDRARLKNTERQTLNDISDAVDSGDQEKIADARARMDEVQRALDVNDQALQKGGREQSAAFRARQMMIGDDYTLSTLLKRAKAASGQPVNEELKAKLEDLSIKLEKAEREVVRHQDRVAELEAQKSVQRMKAQADLSVRRAGRKATSQQLKQEFDDLLHQFGAKAGRASANPLFDPDLYSIVGKLARNRVQAGANTVEGLVDELHTALKTHIPNLEKRDVRDAISGYGRETTPKELSPEVKQLNDLKSQMRELSKQEDVQSGVRENPRLKAAKTRLENQIKQLEEKIAKGDFTRPAKRDALVYDREGNRLLAERNRLQEQIDNEIAKRKEKTVGDYLVRWKRFAVLTYPTSLVKLGVAAGGRMIQTPIEEATGEVLRRVPGVSAIARRAPREGGGLNFRAEAKAISQVWQADSFRGMLEQLKSGRDMLDLLYGNKKTADREFMNLPGRVHGAEKQLPKRAEFFRSFEKRLAFRAKQGQDIADPEVQLAVAMEAHADAMRALFMQPNVISDGFNSAMRWLEARQGRGSKTAHTLAKLGRFEFPITRVPVNYFEESSSLIPPIGVAKGVGELASVFGREAKAGYKTARHELVPDAKGVYRPKGRLQAAKAGVEQMFKNNIQNMSGEEADYILRAWKKGAGVGLAMTVLGFMRPQNFGGYYQQGDKRKEEEAQFGEVMIGGHHVPKWAAHIPLIEAAQFGATVRQVSDEARKKGKKPPLTEGLYAGVKGLAEEVPFVETPKRAVEGLTGDSNRAGRFMGEQTRSFIPGLLQKLAEFMDKDEQGRQIERKPQNFVESVEVGVPYARRFVQSKGGGGVVTLTDAQELKLRQDAAARQAARGK